MRHKRLRTWFAIFAILVMALIPCKAFAFSSEPFFYIEKIGEFKFTAYCSCEKCCGVWAKNRPIDENGEQIVLGASGERLRQGTSVAVDPSVIPYGTVLYAAGRTYVAQDCGGGIKGNRIDVYFENHSDALNFASGEYIVFEIKEK